MNYKQQFSQILNTEFSSCEKSIQLAIEALTGSPVSKVGLSLPKKANTYVLKEVDIYPFTSSIIQNSFFVTAYSFFEYAFRKFCEVIVTDHSAFKRRLSDMDKVYQYYSLVSNIIPIQEPLVSEDWKRLVVYREIRNIIVHHNSIVPGNTTQKTKLTLAEGTQMNPDNLGLIKISENMIKELLDVGLKFLLSLLEIYNHKYPDGIFSDRDKS